MLTVLHLALAQLVGAVGRFLPDFLPIQIASFLVQLPLTPLFVEPEFWLKGHKYEAVKALVVVFNSVLVAGLLLLIAHLVSRSSR